MEKIELTKNTINLIFNGYVHSEGSIPKELNDLIQKMKEAATMTDTAACVLSERNKALFRQSMEEMGFI